MTTHRRALEVALDANAAAYRRAVQSSAPGVCWDFVVLTATNDKQAEGYRRELETRRRGVGPTGAFFPAIQHNVVVADPPGRRAGSGGATFGVFAELGERFDLSPDAIAAKRILLIHSGGASRRLPMYSPLGKIFAPLPLLRPDGQVATLFDHLYLTLAGLPERLGPGTLIVAGDVFLLFDHRHVNTPPPGVTAITMPVDPEIARGHGVFLTDPAGRIRKTLQKVAPAQMADAGIVDAQGNVPIDTGLIFLDADRARLMATLAGCGPKPRKPPAAPRAIHQRFPVPIDLYEDITAAFALDTTPADYIRGVLSKDLWKHFHGIGFHAMTVAGEFLHLGTTLQFRDAMVGANPSPAAALFQQNILAHGAANLDHGQRVYQSALFDDDGATGSIGAGAVVEHSLLRGAFDIGAGSVVSQTVALRRPLRLPPERLLFQTPLRRPDRDLEFAQVLCGVRDDFKTPFVPGPCLFLNQPIERWLDRCGIDPDEIWGDLPPEKRTLWNAAIFICTPRRDDAAAASLISADRPATAALRRWRGAARVSMADILQHADSAAMIAHRDVVTAHLQTTHLLSCIDADDDRALAMHVNHFASPDAYRAVRDLIEDRVRHADPGPLSALHRGRAMATLAQILSRPDAAGAATPADIQRLTHDAYAAVAGASEGSADPDAHTADAERPRRLRPGRIITAAAPVRIDLSGGWSDTPPYCFERGGHVVNLAIDLDGQPPVRAIVRTTSNRRLVLHSRDLGQDLDLTDDAFPSLTPDPRDPFALHKLALRLSGLLPPGVTVAKRLRQLDAGLDVTTECRVPKGSGLGTSSILAATLLAALHRAAGRDLPRDRLIDQTLILEQRLSTGGGWQDQVGGIVGGVKSTVSAPGIPQHPVVEPLDLPPHRRDGLAERLVLYYSGQQRLARDILRRVIGRWIVREPAAVALMNELKDSAAALRKALLAGRWTAVGDEIARYWRIKKDLFPGSTTPAVDVLLLDLRGLYQAAGLAGAGGGGFMYFFCRHRKQADQLRAALAERAAQPGSLGSVYATRINPDGLTLSDRPDKP